MKNKQVTIDGETVTRNSQYNNLIKIIEEAFIAYDNGNVESPDKSYVDIEKYNGDFRSMPAYINTDNWEASGIKWVNVHPDNEKHPTVMGTFVYTDPKNGRPLAIMNGTEITKRRTAAVAAVATDYLSSESATSLGILGAGVQSYEQVKAISEIRDIKEIYVSDIDNDAINRFVEHFSEEYEVNPTTPEDLTNCNILCTTTPIEEPIINELKNENIHINAMGADAPQKQELDESIICNENNKIIVDGYSQAIHSGEISKSISKNKLSKEQIHADLGSIVNNNHNLKDNVTIFDSTGLAIQDVATAHLVYKSAKENECDILDIF